MIRHFLNPPNWFTAASLMCSTTALCLLVGREVGPDDLVKAAILVIFGGIFDMMDGRVARLTRRGSDFGVQLDSIADVVGFGVAPAVIAYVWTLHHLGALGVAVAVWYVIAAAFRLARFNVATRESNWPFVGHSQGLTTTMAGGSLVSLIWVSNGILRDFVQIEAAWVAVLVGGLGLLMVSSIPFRNFKDLRANRNARRLAGVMLGSCLAGALVFDISMWWGVGAALYLSAGLLDGLVVAVQHRRLEQALLLEELGDALREVEDAEPEEEAEVAVREP